MNHLVEPVDPNEPIKLTGQFRQAPPTLPSRNITKRDAHWSEKFLVAQSYMWGRKDAGEQTDPNDDMRFCEAYADAYWLFNRHERVFMPSLSTALERFRADGKF